jgi:hypothetical protein
MKVGLFNTHNSYLFYDLQEAFKLNNVETVTAFTRSMVGQQVGIIDAIKDLDECRQKLTDCDYVIHVNYDPLYEEAKIFPVEKTCCLFFDPPAHFPSPKNIGMSLQMLKVGPHKRIEWGVMQRFFDPQNQDIKYGAAAFMRLYLDQADAVYHSGRKDVASNFYNAAFERIAGCKLAMKIEKFQPFAVFGGKDYSKFGLNTVMNKHEDLHLFMAQSANIIDHCREEIGENPKFLYACAMDKPFYNIQSNKQTGQVEIVRQAWRKPRHIKEFGAELIDLLVTELARRDKQFDGAGQMGEVMTPGGSILHDSDDPKNV